MPCIKITSHKTSQDQMTDHAAWGYIDVLQELGIRYILGKTWQRKHCEEEHLGHAHTQYGAELYINNNAAA